MEDMTDKENQSHIVKTGLHKACSRGSHIVVRDLLDMGAKADIQDEYGDTPLHEAAVKNHPDIVTMLLERTENKTNLIDIQNKEGQTALHAACVKGSHEVVEILLNSGADPTILDREGDSVLYYGVRSKSIKIVNTLLIDHIKHKRDVRRKFKTCKTVLHYASKYGLEDVVRELLKNGMDVDAVDDDGNTALYYAVKNNHPKVAQLCMDNLTQIGKTSDQRNKEGVTVVHQACYHGMLEILKKNMGNYSQFDVEDKSGDTVLHWAVYGEQPEVVELLLKNRDILKIDVDMANKRGQTALHIASKKGNRLIVELLIEHGAKHPIEDANSLTALDISLEHLDEDEEKRREQHSEVVTILLDKMTTIPRNIDKQYKEGKTALHYACRLGLESLVERILERGARVDMVDKDGDTVLHESARENYGVADILLSSNADLINHKNNSGRTPLHYASFYGCPAVMKSLLSAGGDVGQVDDWGDSPLHDAAGRNHHEVVQIIMDRNSMNVDIQNKNGQTPLHIACSQGATKVVCILLDHGANLDIVDKRRNTPLTIALIKNKPEVVKILTRRKSVTLEGRKSINTELTDNLAAISNHREIVRFIVEEVSFDLWKNAAPTLLRSAVRRNDKDMVAYLVDRGIVNDEFVTECEDTTDSEADSDDDSDVDSGGEEL